MPLVRKRRAATQLTADDDDVSQEEAPSQIPHQRVLQQESEDEEYGEGENGVNEDNGSLDQLVKKLVRLALACEYARIPIRRVDINAKVLGTHSRQFKAVFQEAQLRLQAVFGMEMVELPMREKVTIQQMRAAQKSEKQPTSSNAWVLTSTLPPKFRTPEIIPPPKVPTSANESTYVALYSFIISCIYLSGGSLPEAKLERYLKRTNADTNTPIEKTDKLIQRLVKDGYIVKIRDTSSGEEVIEYMVGPRGKVEVGEEGVAGLVKTVYGEGAPDDLDKRLERSLGLGQRMPAANGHAAAHGARRAGDEQEESEDDD